MKRLLVFILCLFSLGSYAWAATESITIDANGDITVANFPLTLRSVTDSWGTTKGASLTFSELDNTHIRAVVADILLAPQSGTADTLDQINGTNLGRCYILRTGSNNTITVEDNDSGTGNIRLRDNTEAVLIGPQDKLQLCRTGEGLIEIGRTNQVPSGSRGVSFVASDTNPVCAAGAYFIFADLSEASLKKCENGVVSTIAGGAANADSITINGTPIDTTMAFDSSTDITVSVADGGAGGPDTVTLTVASNAITDAKVVDTITVSNYLPLAGGTLTGQIVADNLGIEFEESETNPTCGAGNFNIFADLSDGEFKKCEDGTVSTLGSGTGGSSSLKGAYNNGRFIDDLTSPGTAVVFCGDSPLNNCADASGIRWYNDTGGFKQDLFVSPNFALASRYLLAPSNKNVGLFDEEGARVILDCDPDAVATGDGECTLSDDLTVTGTVAGKLREVEATSTPIALTAAQMSGQWHVNDTNGAKEFDLPALAGCVGCSACFETNFAQVVTIDPNGTEIIQLNGVDASAGEAIVSSGALADFVCIKADSNQARWRTRGIGGTWAEAVP